MNVTKVEYVIKEIEGNAVEASKVNIQMKVWDGLKLLYENSQTLPDSKILDIENRTTITYRLIEFLDDYAEKFLGPADG